MLPVLISFGGVSLSSFGLFLTLGLFTALFSVWRLAKIYDLDEESLSTVTLLTFLGGLLGARILAIVLNLNNFDSLDKLILINRYPGLSFWGGLIGGLISFIFIYKRYKLPFWPIADFGVVALMIGLSIGEIGCFLGGCNSGIVSQSFLAFPVIGLIGKRLPVSLIESLLFFIIFLRLWRSVVRYHILGKVAALGLVWLGLIKFVTEFYKDSPNQFNLPLGHLSSIALFFSALIIYYLRVNKNPIDDLKAIWSILVTPKKRNLLLQSLKKSWYNFRVYWKVKFQRSYRKIRSWPGKLITFLSKLKRRLNVKTTPDNIS